MIDWVFSTHLALFLTILLAVSRAQDEYYQREKNKIEARKVFVVIRGRAFVRRKAFYFFWLFALTVFLTMGEQFCPDASFFNIHSQATSNVYCKIDNVTELTCLVDVQYSHPSHAEASPGERCKNKFAQWDFCGGLRVPIPLQLKQHIHTIYTVMFTHGRYLAGRSRAR